ncbi:MAG: RagB/SusD family nutrient uptake outer membrane protein [Bacteroidales bacterium]
MKFIKKYTIILTGLLIGGCSDYLDVAPDNIATIDIAFRNRTDAERYLFTCYSYCPRIKDIFSNPALSAGDEAWPYDNLKPDGAGYVPTNSVLFDIPMGLQSVTSPLADYWSGARGGVNLWQGIRDCNVFLENIDRTVDLDEEERKRWVAEVIFLKAYYHYFLLRMYGPIPIVKENLPVSISIADVKIFREPVDECFDYVVQLLDEASVNLPLVIEDRANELGRITKPAALALKADVLVTAASPLFNGNSDYAAFRDERGIDLFTSEYDPQKWQKAADACLDAINYCHEAGIRLLSENDVNEGGRYSLPDSLKRSLIARVVVTEKWNPEQIWSSTEYVDGNRYPYFSIPVLDIGSETGDNSQPFHAYAPTLRMAELFYSDKGVPITEDSEWSYSDRYDVTVADYDLRYYIHPGLEVSNLCFNREPRFYGSLALDGMTWFGYTKTDPENLCYLKCKAGELGGIGARDRFNETGIYNKKVVHIDSNVKKGNKISFVRYPFPIYRLADIYLLYAECLNETKTNPDAEVYEYIDKVRNKTGLEGVVRSWQNYSNKPSKPMSKSGMREIIHQERLIELAFEGKRYWDLRRWKKLQEYLNTPIRGFNIRATDAKAFNVSRQIFRPVFSLRDYLYPIKESLLLENPNLVQNPQW